jgi:S-DNA-T family DNA segregation ATPase FtsK/SpoIIIE
VQLKPTGEEDAAKSALKSRDDLYESAIDVLIREGRGSVSLLQRSLGIGYGRAARLIDFMAEDGIVGPYNGSQAREVLVTAEEWKNMSSDSKSTALKPATTNQIKLVTAEVEEADSLYANQNDLSAAIDLAEEYKTDQHDDEVYEDEELMEEAASEEAALGEEEEYKDDESEEAEYKDDESAEYKDDEYEEDEAYEQEAV